MEHLTSTNLQNTPIDPDLEAGFSSELNVFHSESPVSEIFLDNEKLTEEKDEKLPGVTKTIQKSFDDKKKYSNITNELRLKLLDAVENKVNEKQHEFKKEIHLHKSGITVTTEGIKHISSYASEKDAANDSKEKYEDDKNIVKDDDNSNPNKKARTPMICHKCGSVGHKAASCPIVQQKEPGKDGRSAPRPLETVTCFKCGQMGHYANHCNNRANPRATPAFNVAMYQPQLLQQ